MSIKRIASILGAVLLGCLPGRSVANAQRNLQAPVVHVIRIDGDIDASADSMVTKELAAAKKDKSAYLDIHINSPGGSVPAGLDIIQKIKDSNLQTVCTVEGLAASMAWIIFESPACQYRRVHPFSLLMTHGVLMQGSSGNQRQQENNLARMSAMNKVIAVIVAPRIQMTVPEYLRRVVEEGEELWTVGIDAVDEHVADEVVP